MGNGCNKKTNIEPPNNNSIINWKSDTITYKYHWWPMYNHSKNDITNNLYAIGGCLDKYDFLFNTKAVSFQKSQYYRDAMFSNNDNLCAGFCDNASILSCLYKHPKYSVIICYRGNQIIFSPKDIEGLMIIASKNAIKSNISLFFGIRNNLNNKKDLGEPTPRDLIHMLKIITKDKEPFVMDIDNKTPVWNYSYDSVKITEHDICPFNHIKPQNGETKYYNFKINSIAYPKQNQDLWGYTHYNNLTKIKTSKWLSETHPGFIWKKFPIETPWNGKCIINPEVDAKIVYRLYQNSLVSTNNILVLR